MSVRRPATAVDPCASRHRAGRRAAGLRVIDAFQRRAVEALQLALTPRTAATRRAERAWRERPA
jgi:hypothetical protein